MRPKTIIFPKMCAYMPRVFPISGNQNTQYIMKHFLLKTWLMLICFLAGAGVTWADSAILTENFTSSKATQDTYDCGSNLTTPANLADFDYTWTLDSGSGTCFKNGIKLGGSNATGAIKSNDIVAGIPTGTSFTVKVYAAVWNKDGGSISVVYNGDEKTAAAANDAITSTSKTYSSSDFTSSTDFTFTKTETGNSITIGSSAKRILIDKVEIVYDTDASGETPTTPQTYTLTFANNAHCSFSAIVDGNTVESGNNVEAGKEVTVSCTPANGYEFNGWNIYRTGNEHYLVSFEDNTFTMPDAAVTVDAYLIENTTGGTTGTFNSNPEFDFVTHPAGWPTATKEGSYKYTLDDYDYTFNLANGIYCAGSTNTSGYLMIQKNTALGLPAIPGYKLTKVVGTLNAGGTPSTQSVVSITDGSKVVVGGNGQIWNEKGKTFTYSLSGTLSNTMYYLSVSTANCQMTHLALTYTPADSSEDITATLSIANITVAMDEDINPVITTNVTGDYLIEYVSGNEEVVLAADDELVTTGIGTATITATLIANGYTTAETTFTVTVTAGGSTGGDVDFSNFIKNKEIGIVLNDETYDISIDLNIPKGYDKAPYSIRTTINGKTEEDGVFACIYPWLSFLKTGKYTVHVECVNGENVIAEGYITVTVFDPNGGDVDPETPPTVKEYASLAALVADGAPTKEGRMVKVTLTNEKIERVFVTQGDGYRNGIFLKSGNQEVEIYYFNVPEEWVAGGTVSGTITCPWKLYSSTWELAPEKDTWNWNGLQYTAPTEVEVQQYTVTYTAPEHGTLVVMNGEEQLESDAKVDNGTRLTLVLSPASGYEFAKWEACAGDKVIYTCDNERRDWTVNADVEFKAYFREVFVEPQGEKVTWNLAIDETTAATEEHLLWRNNVAMMETVKASGATNANNYYPGTPKQEYKSTRFYKNNSFVITPAPGITINAVVAECTTDAYTNSLVNSTWTNATATRFGNSTKVTITPTDGTEAVSAVLGGTTGATSVTVYYTGTSQGWPEVTTYAVNVDEKIEGGIISASAESAEAGATITLTATPADGYEFTSWNVTLVDDASAVEVKDNKFTMPEGDVNVSATFTKQEVTPDEPSEHTIVCKDVTWTVGKDENGTAQTLSVTTNDYTVLCQKNNGGSAPTFVGGENNNDVRVYAKGTITISSEIPFTSVVFNISTQGLKRLAPITANRGTIAPQASGDQTVSWSSATPVTSVTFTVGEKADYGSDGNEKAGQLDFTSIDIVAGEAPATIGNLVKYIIGLKNGEGTLEELQNIVNRILGK